jgi:iron(III) transport system substrate-binding protein
MLLGALGSALALLPSASLAASKDRTIKMYTTRHYASDQQVSEAFTKATGITVQTVQIKDASAMVARILAEKDKPQADLVIATDTGNLLRLAEGGVFEPLNSKTVKDVVPETFRDAGDLWTGVAMRVRVIAYNKDKVKPEEIPTMERLADPKFKGRVLVRPSNHVYNQSLAATMLAVSGPEGLRTWAKGITNNLARKPQGGDTDQLKAIAAGEGDVAIVNSYYLARLMDSKDDKDRAIAAKIGVVFPNQGDKDRGTHVNVSGIGVLKGTKKGADARAFVEFLLTPEAQKNFVSGSKEYPVREGVPLEQSLQAWGKPQLDRKGLAVINKHTPEAVRILEDVGWR